MIERKFIRDGLTATKVDAYLKKHLKRAGYIEVDIQKTPVTTRIAIQVERPGLVIGRKGSSIQALTKTLEKEFGFENVQIKVADVPIPELNESVMAKRIANSLERGMNFRRVLHWTLEKIMKAGAKGAEIVISGKIIGKGGKARHERVSAGYLKKAGESSKLVRTAQTQAIKKAGIVGVTVSIVPPEVVFPDKVDIKKALSQLQGGEANEPTTEIKSDQGTQSAGKTGKDATVEN